MQKKTAYGNFKRLLLTILLSFCALSFSAIPAWAHDAALPSFTAQPGDTLTMALTFSDNNIGIFAADTTLNYDPAVLEFVSISPGASFPGFGFITNTTVPGLITTSHFGFTPVSDTSGELYTLVFNVRNDAPAGTHFVSISQVDFSDDLSTIPVTVANSSVITIAAGPNPDAANIVINEISPDNLFFLDDDGDSPNWLEFYNTGSTTVNMANLQLAYQGTTFVMPNVDIDPMGYLIVFLSGKDRVDTHVHANFVIPNGGGALEYRNADGSLIETVTNTPQLPDQTFGRFPNGSGPFQTLNTATPGAENITGDPVLDPIGNQTTAQNQNLAFMVSASDPTNDPLTLSATGLPIGASFTDNGNGTGNFSWTPIGGQQGSFNITFTVNDGAGGSDSETITVTVTPPANNPPVLNPIGDRTVNVQEEVSFVVLATDSDGDTLTYPDPPEGLPIGATFGFNPSGKLFSWTPTDAFIGETVLTFRADDGNGGIDSETVTITVVGSANQPPVLDPIGNKNTIEGGVLNFNVTGSDPDGDSTTISITSGLQGWMSFDGSAFSGTPDFNDSGSYNVTFQISDGSLTDTETITITVANSNRSPVLAPIGDKSVDENNTLSFGVSATDDDGDSITITTSVLQSWMNFNGVTFTGTPGSNDAGTYQITFTASDGNGGSDSETITITVNNVNRAPVMASVSDQNLTEGDTTSFGVSATDPDGDSLSISFSGTEAWMAFDGSTLTLTPTVGDAGTYPVSFTASDGQLSDTENFTITVDPLQVNAPPVLDSVGNQSLEEGQQIVLTLTASDPDGDPLTFDALGLEPWMSFSGNQLTLSPQLGDAGDYQVTVMVDDGELSDDEIITVSVLQANQAPTLNLVGDQSVDEGNTLNISLSATDPDGDAITFSVTGLQSWMTLSGNSLSITPGFSDSGNYVLTVIASDGELTDEETITLTVNNINQAPILDPIGDQSIDEGEAGSAVFTASDPDGDALTFSLINAPSFITLSSNTVSVNPDFEDAGSYVITIRVTDGTLFDEETITLTVVDINRAPNLDNIGNQSVPEGDNLSFGVTASDPDGDMVTITTSALESWMSFDGSTFTANPQLGDAGNYQVTFTASDGQLTDDEIITISVGDVNQAPELATIGNQSVDENSSNDITLSATDPDGDPLTFSAMNLQPWMSLVGNTLNLSPTFDDDGAYEITVKVSDGVLEDSETLNVAVNNVNQLPVLNSIGDQSVAEGEALNFTVTANDADGDSLVITTSQLQTWMSFDGANFNATPQFGDAGTYQITFTVTDGEATDSETITIVVGAVNQAPELVQLPEQFVNESQTLDVSVSASDPDGDALTFSATNLQPWMSFSGTLLSLAPGFDDSGSYQVTVTVSDGSLTDVQDITITVLDINRAPVLDEVGNQSVAEESNLNFEVTASDPDGDSIIISASPLESWMSFDGSAFDANPQNGDAGNYSITFLVSDGELTDEETIALSVGDVNQAPKLDNIGDQTLDEGQILEIILSASDPDGDTPTFEIQGAPSFISINANLVTLAPGFEDAGAYSLTVIVSDGDLTDSETIAITVNNVNRSPVLEAIGDQMVSEGETLELNFMASDPDMDSLTFEVSGLESWMTFSGSTLILNPLNGDAGTYSITVSVTDGQLSMLETISILVKETQNNSPPELQAIGDKEVQEGEQLIFDVMATDPNEDDLEFTVTGLTSWMNFIGNRFSASPQEGDAGQYPVEFEVTDGEFTDSEIILITVTEMSSGGNAAPVLDPIGNQSVKEAETLVFAITGSDPDSDPIMFSASGLPEAADFSSAGSFMWTPEKGDAGDYEVTFFISDGSLTDQETIIISVVAEGFTLNAEDFPYHQSLDNGTDPVEKFSSAAVLKMLLQYIWWNRLDNPEGPPVLEDPQLSMQQLLFEHGQQRNYPINQDLMRIDGWGIWTTIQDLDPPYNPYHYNFGLKSRSTLEEALRDIGKWLAYPAGGGSANPNGHGVDGYPVYIPGAVPLYGDYDHWVVIKGIHATKDPWNNSDFGICGFWINDPHPQGLGENTFVTAEQFTDVYYKPLTEINPEDPLYNRYVALLEPPLTEEGDVTIVESQPRLRKRVDNFFQLKTVELDDGSHQAIYVRDHLDEDAFTIIDAAIDGIQSQLVPFDTEFATLFEQTIPRKPIYVESDTGGNYYLVPFELPIQGEAVALAQKAFKRSTMVDADGTTISKDDRKKLRKAKRKARKKIRKRTVIIALIDADSGAFKEVTWVKEPIRYLPVGKKRALRLLSKFLNPDSDRKSRRGDVRRMLEGAELELFHAEGSFYYPSWRIYHEGLYYQINQDKSVIPLD